MDRIIFNNINDTCNYFHSSFWDIFYIFSYSYSWIYHSLGVLGLFLLVVLLVVMIVGGAIISTTYSK